MANKNRHLGVFLMGGTIDSRNNPQLDGEVVPLKTSVVSRYLESLKSNFKIELHQICLKDSRGITEDDRAQLFDEIQKQGLKYNIVTHGTYTMGLTARDLFNRGLGEDKVVIVTGSMEPILGSIDDEGHLAPSDAQFNLGYAIASSFNLENGIYVSMSGDVFKQPDEEWVHDEDGIRWTGM